MLKLEKLTFTIAPCNAGFVLVGHSRKGVCAIVVADTPEQAFHHFSDRFAKCELEEDDAGLGPVAYAVASYADHPKGKLKLKLDMRGTAFQIRVWKAVMQVPAGRTATYSDIACAIGAPSSARAVGTACGKNPLSVVVPCHRIMRSGKTPSDAPGEAHRRRLRALEAPEIRLRT